MLTGAQDSSSVAAKPGSTEAGLYGFIYLFLALAAIGVGVTFNTRVLLPHLESLANVTKDNPFFIILLLVHPTNVGFAFFGRLAVPPK